MSDTRIRPARDGSASTITPNSHDGHPRALLVVILVAYLMLLINNSIVFTAVPSVRADLNLSVTGASWVQDAYGLTFGGLLLGARLGGCPRFARTAGSGGYRPGRRYRTSAAAPTSSADTHSR